jgi:hypothetical protein
MAPERPPPFSGLMTNCPHRRDTHDVEEETYTHWLDNNCFLTMQLLVADRGCEDVAVLRSIPTGEPLGVFHAVSTRDGVARERNGQDFFAANPKGIDSQGVDVYEVRFADGFWMLTTADDLEPTPAH